MIVIGYTQKDINVVNLVGLRDPQFHIQLFGLVLDNEDSSASNSVEI